MLRGYPATGTVHIEIHPEMAWQLNLLLSSRYPMAIASKHRKAPKTKAGEPMIIHDLLPMDVANALYMAEQLYTPCHDRATMSDVVPVENGVILSHWLEKKNPDNQSLIRAIDSVIESIGGVAYPHSPYPAYVFPYDAIPVLKRIGLEGRLPEKYSHQYFGTPAHIAEQAIALASVGDNGRAHWGELSAGTGNIARLMPLDRTTCVEINAVYVEILRAHGLTAIEANVLEWFNDTHLRFDRIVINPPYSNKQWQKHTEVAMSMLLPKGRLVAILPTGSAKILKERHAKWKIEIHDVHHNAFADTAISVEVVVIDNPFTW